MPRYTGVLISLMLVFLCISLNVTRYPAVWKMMKGKPPMQRLIPEGEESERPREAEKEKRSTGRSSSPEPKNEEVSERDVDDRGRVSARSEGYSSPSSRPNVIPLESRDDRSRSSKDDSYSYEDSEEDSDDGSYSYDDSEENSDYGSYSYDDSEEDSGYGSYSYDDSEEDSDYGSYSYDDSEEDSDYGSYSYEDSEEDSDYGSYSYGNTKEDSEDEASSYQSRNHNAGSRGGDGGSGPSIARYYADDGSSDNASDTDESYTSGRVSPSYGNAYGSEASYHHASFHPESGAVQYRADRPTQEKASTASPESPEASDDRSTMSSPNDDGMLKQKKGGKLVPVESSDYSAEASLRAFREEEPDYSQAPWQEEMSENADLAGEEMMEGSGQSPLQAADSSEATPSDSGTLPRRFPKVEEESGEEISENSGHSTLNDDPEIPSSTPGATEQEYQRKDVALPLGGTRP